MQRSSNIKFKTQEFGKKIYDNNEKQEFTTSCNL